MDFYFNSNKKVKEWDNLSPPFSIERKNPAMTPGIFLPKKATCYVISLTTLNIYIGKRNIFEAKTKFIFI